MDLQQIEQICDVNGVYLPITSLAFTLSTRTKDNWYPEQVAELLSELGLLHIKSDGKHQRTVYCRSSRAFCKQHGSLLKWNIRLVDALIRHAYGTDVMRNLDSIKLDYDAGL